MVLLSMFQRAVVRQDVQWFADESRAFLDRRRRNDLELDELRDYMIVAFRAAVTGYRKARTVGVPLNVRIGNSDRTLNVKVDPDVGIETFMGGLVLKVWLEEDAIPPEQAAVCQYLMRQGSKRLLWGDVQYGVWGIRQERMWLAPYDFDSSIEDIVSHGAEDFLAMYDNEPVQRRFWEGPAAA